MLEALNNISLNSAIEFEAKEEHDVQRMVDAVDNMQQEQHTN
jgi:hypothetical protein